ncbi:hypothetical protein NC653_010027 [Populus alba x Populus x berolinensis]|uniref:Uncharacterized protein n=1 Tax=Populus alba x Populus x berolinensis TaxID=444605 RepID=A0AAD6RAJ1_9ROSI|nr:hypothetical protein NC653_010027 [Populus alba x Populus x berolinensis]
MGNDYKGWLNMWLFSTPIGFSDLTRMVIRSEMKFKMDQAKVRAGLSSKDRGPWNTLLQAELSYSAADPLKIKRSSKVKEPISSTRSARNLKVV